MQKFSARRLKIFLIILQIAPFVIYNKGEAYGEGCPSPGVLGLALKHIVKCFYYGENSGKNIYYQMQHFKRV